jgi:hypothetical protein
MKKILPLTILFLLFISCKRDCPCKVDRRFNATIIGVGTYCGGRFLIQFDKPVKGISQNISSNICYEVNLSNQYKVPGKRIGLEYRAPKPEEDMACTAMGPAYPHIFITRVNAFEN